jgi:hypothetical protein
MRRLDICMGPETPNPISVKYLSFPSPVQSTGLTGGRMYSDKGDRVCAATIIAVIRHGAQRSSEVPFIVTWHSQL